MNRVSRVGDRDSDFDWQGQEEAPVSVAGLKNHRPELNFPQPRLADFNTEHGSVLRHSGFWDEGQLPTKPPVALTITTYWWS